MNSSRKQEERNVADSVQRFLKDQEILTKGYKYDLEVEQNKNKKLAKEKEIIYNKGKGYQEKYDALLVENTKLTEQMTLLKNGQSVPCLLCESYKSQLTGQKDIYEKTYHIVLQEKDKAIDRLERNIKSLQKQAKQRSKKHFQSVDTECDTLIPESCDEMDTLKVQDEENDVQISKTRLLMDKTKDQSGLSEAPSKDSGIEREVTNFEKNDKSMYDLNQSEISPGRNSRNPLKLPKQGKRSRYRYTEESPLDNKRQKVIQTDSSYDYEESNEVISLISKEETQAVSLASLHSHKFLVPETCVGQYTMDTSVFDSINVAVKEKRRTDTATVKKSSRLNKLERPDIVIPETVPFDAVTSDEDSNDSFNSSQSVLPQPSGNPASDVSDCDVMIIKNQDNINTTGKFFFHSKSNEEQCNNEIDITSKESHGNSPVFGTPKEKKKLNPEDVASKRMSPSPSHGRNGGKTNLSKQGGRYSKLTSQLPKTGNTPQESFRKKYHVDLDTSTASNPSPSVLSGRPVSQADTLPVEQPDFDDGHKRFPQDRKRRTASSQPDQISLALAYSTRSQNQNSLLSVKDYKLQKSVTEPCIGKNTNLSEPGKLEVEPNTGPKKKYIQSKITPKTFQSKSTPVNELKEFNGGRLCSSSQGKMSEREMEDIDKAIRLSMAGENSQGRILRSQRNASQRSQHKNDSNVEMDDIQRAFEISVRDLENIENTLNHFSGQPRMTSTPLPTSPCADASQKDNRKNVGEKDVEKENVLFKKPSEKFPLSPRKSPRLKNKFRRASQDDRTSSERREFVQRNSSRFNEDSFQSVPHSLMPTDLENGSIDPNIRLSQYEDDSGLNDSCATERIGRRKNVHSRTDQTKNKTRLGIRVERTTTQSIESDVIDSSGKSVVFGKRPKQQAPSVEENEQLNDSVGDIFDTQAYEDEDAEESIHQETLVSIEELHSMPDNSFDVVPSKLNEPDYAYVGAPVRKQEERRKMNAYACRECWHWFKGMDLSEAEVEKRMKNCKHKAKFQAPGTPEHFWSIGFPDTQVCEERGYMNTTQAKPSTFRRKRKYKQLFNGKEKADLK